MSSQVAAASLQTSFEACQVVNAVRRVIVVELQRIVGLSARWRKCKSIVVAVGCIIKALVGWIGTGLENWRIVLEQILRIMLVLD